MKLPMFSIRDNVANHFHPPFVAPNAAVAERFFQEQLDDVSTIYGRHPNDYTLWESGTFDDELGLCESFMTCRPVKSDYGLRAVNG
ncbi:MAG: nonstructural protein [Microvirus sp.]|nr:MAG: nonstructural protein [Microvirus sp.]